MTVNDFIIEIKSNLTNKLESPDLFLPIPEIKGNEDFRKMLVRRCDEHEIDKALLLLVRSSLDPDNVFESSWKSGPLCSELFPKATAKYLNQIPKKVRRCSKILSDIYFEAPVSYNPQNAIYVILGNQALRTLKIVSGLCFENPDLNTKLNTGWKKAVEKYFGSNYRWQKTNEASKLFGFPIECGDDMPFDSYNKFLGTPMKEGDSADYFNDLYTNPETHKVTGTEMKTRSYDYDVYKDHPEALAFGWFKELRKQSPGLEKYLKETSIDYTTEDIYDILIYSEIILDDESINPEKALDLFWENSDAIYEKMFHSNILQTPIRLARTYISMFT